MKRCLFRVKEESYRNHFTNNVLSMP